MLRRKILVPIAVLVVVAAAIVGVCTGHSTLAVAKTGAAQTYPATVTPAEEAAMTGDIAPVVMGDGSIVVPDGFPGVVATGPVPEYIQVAATAGDAGAQVAKYMWDHGAKVVPFGEGKFAVPMPKQIPPGIVWPAQEYPARLVAASASESDNTPVPPPLFLSPDELSLWDNLVASGAGFSVIQGQDGYVHIQTDGVGK